MEQSASLQSEDHYKSSIQASLVRVNACCFEDRYTMRSHSLVGSGAFGRVHRCIDNLTQTSRAVKRVRIPSDAQQRETLNGEVSCLAALDHPHVVRLIEYFNEDGEVLMVMELLEGPTLGVMMQNEGRFTEAFAARCLRHMLKALFCCHCLGIIHNDVTKENFQFQSAASGSILKMVDLGLSVQIGEAEADAPASKPGHDSPNFAYGRDIWDAGVILFNMLSGLYLFQNVDAMADLQQKTDPLYVPSRVRSLDASADAQGILENMLAPTSVNRLSAREVLLQPFITKFYYVDDGGKDSARENNVAARLTHCLSAFRAFHEAKAFKRLVFVVVAHLLTNNNETLARQHWLFRWLIRDGQRADEQLMRKALEECNVDVPPDFSTVFNSADVTGSGGLDYVEFVAASISIEPKLFCSEGMLRSAFRFFDSDDSGIISDDVVHSIFHWPMCQVEGLVYDTCGADMMSFEAFEAMMMPEDWDEARSAQPAAWSDAPDAPCDSLSAPIPSQQARFENPVKSRPSKVFAVCQRPGFYSAALSSFYSMQEVSNVVMGIIRGTSSYARKAVALHLAEVIVLGASNGVLFIMPNPKYHWDVTKVVRSADAPLRFVGWWIHPSFVEELQRWVASQPRASQDELVESPANGNTTNVGSPGDFGFSDIKKPVGYLHTYRDFTDVKHLEMLEAMVTGIGLFLGRLLGSELPSARLKAGFHYPVRSQYSTLHLQLRVNSGNVVGGPENRGVDLFQLLSQLRLDPHALRPDDETLHFQATSNLRAALLAAASSADASIQEVGPQSLVLG